MAILSSHRTGIVNVRDIGGYQAVDGMKVKKELLIRGTSLATAKDADLAQLAALPVVKVIDFRTDFEKKGKENKSLPGANYICLPIRPVDDGAHFCQIEHSVLLQEPLSLCEAIDPSDLEV